MMKMTEKRLKYGNPKDAVDKAKKVGNFEVGFAIASQAKLLAPVDYGQLRNSISASSRTQTRGLNDRRFTPKSTPMETGEPLDTSELKGDEVIAGTNSDHAIFMEYGTIKLPAQPFLRPSVELIIDRKQASDIVAKYCKDEMDKELKKRILEKSKTVDK